MDRIFLNYPPQTPFPAFHGFIKRAKEKGVRHITYLSVKDVQFLPFVPHFKNEKCIRQSGIPFTFLRAGYFSQNLNMFLRDELVRDGRIYVPAGKGRTSFVDLRDIAEVAAAALTDADRHRNQTYVLTGEQALDFDEIADTMTRILNRKITYSNPSMKEFKSYMVRKGLEPQYVNVVAGLHLFTKLGLAKGIRSDVHRVLNRPPVPVDQYVEDHREFWAPQTEPTVSSTPHLAAAGAS